MLATVNERVKVESFECTETASEPIEACEEALQIMESLGLKGQTSLVSDNKDGNKQRCPYRKMTEDERFTYSVLCPDESKIEEYDNSPIPLRVLQIAAHAKEVLPACEMVIWDKEKATIKDPVLVAKVKGKSWRPENYILARWGEVLETFSTLAKQAIDLHRTNLIEQAKSALSKAENSSTVELMKIDKIHLDVRY